MSSIRHVLQTVALLLLITLIGVFPRAHAAPGLDKYLATTDIADIFPGADRLDRVQGDPPVAKAWSDGQHVGYVFLNSDIVNATGYSSKPIHILVGLSLEGEIVGLKLVEHDEPIVLIGISIDRINTFINGYIGLNFIKNPPKGRMSPPVDIISGVTVTLMVIGDSVTRSSLVVARSLGIGRDGAAPVAAAAPPSIDTAFTEKQSWDALLSNGGVQRMLLTVGDVNSAFESASNKKAAEHPESGEPDDVFIDMYVAQVSVPAIGRSLLADATWNQLQNRLAPGQQAIVVAGNGPYSFKGSGYVRGGIFDRIEILQGPHGFRFRDLNHQRLGDLMAEGAPSFREIALFVVPEDQIFNATDPWQIQLLVQRIISVQEKAFMTFNLGYQIPDDYLIHPEPAPSQTPASGVSPTTAEAQPDAYDAALNELDDSALWKHMWKAKSVQIAVLIVALLILTSVFFFQNWFARHPVFYDRFRMAYLAFTLFWLGGYAMAQLSVVNVLTFTHSLRTGFQWEYFLMDPLVFILWCATAISALFWNRGAFCGWLCPFGSLQELMNRAARTLKIKQIRIPFGVHERLVAFKYVIFLALFAFSLYDLGFAERMSEVEPFKTTIILKFMRYWPYVLFAAAILTASLFIERFYCRYMCPLGAALAIPARLRLFDWLKRYKECGNPCQRCAIECPVDAIHPEGHINPNECIQCLNCQVLYHHDKKCPHLIKKNAKRARKPAPVGPEMQAQSASRLQPKPGARVIPRSPDEESPAGKQPA